MTYRKTQVRARQRLDPRLAKLRELGPRPARGWVRAVRNALGMSGAELARRAGISQSRISQIERAEASGSLKLETLMHLAEALDCTLVYGLLPNTSLQNAVHARARDKAQRRLAPVAHSMRLEDQEVGEDAASASIDELAELFIGRPGLWSDP